VADVADAKRRRELLGEAKKLIAKADMLRVVMTVIDDRLRDKGNTEWAYTQLEALLNKEAGS